MVEEKEEENDVNQEAIELSLIEKEKGNIMFKKGNYKRAIQYYTKSKELDPSNAVFPLNRAMAYLKLKKYSEAENDCTDCIALAPKNVKALYRRGLARVGLKKYHEAKSDFEAAVVLEPSNKQAKDELNKVLAILKPKPKEEPKQENNTSNPTVVKKPNQLKKKKSTITKEQEEKLKNKPVRRRLQIIEVGRSSEEIQKEEDEKLYKKIEEDINEINELIKSSNMAEEKNETISITKNNSEESITPLDMVPVSTTKKSNNTNKKQPRKMKIVEKEDMDDEKEVKEQQSSDNDQKEIKEIIEKPSTSVNTQLKPESKKSNELLNGKSKVISSFIFNKENETLPEKEETKELKNEENQPKLTKKRSVVIEEVDEIINEYEALKPINEITIEEIKNEEEKPSSKIEIIEKEKEEGPKIQIIEEINDATDTSSKIQIIENKETEESKINEVIETPKEIIKEEPLPKKIRPKIKVATTMYDFERDWKSMKNDDQKTFEYLSSIIPENLPSLFKNSLESDYLTRMLVIIKKFYIEENMFDEIYDTLNSIQKVNRFDMTLMFMTRKDKQILQDIFDAMKSNQSNQAYSMTDLEILAKKYKMNL
ncbi:hypothetical protein BCR36DRAFT_583283 [Piromyces finnis]|uniref:RNA polymerase II-associated protein 3 n=1 Tax=Piromyces finnis TaxID=1754191 RepID=A0A1Y1VAV7_9FUNG|nr:hypothetical protein BCR36DRAFT_583283 [Piromyces finnis]|eukprot:ORX50698.1 hypothetical protein BCR36DRAFT_583283 [Piromyces finnis]